MLPIISLDPAVYPVIELYPAIGTLRQRIPTGSQIQPEIPRVKVPFAQSPRVAKYRSRFGGHDGIPPVPRLPQNIDQMKPMSPYSRLPLYDMVKADSKAAVKVLVEELGVIKEHEVCSFYPYLNICKQGPPCVSFTL